MAVLSSERADTRSFLGWGGVFAGAIVGLATLFLFNSLWVALGDGSNVDWVARNIHWFGLVSSLIGLFVGGLVAGRMAHGGSTGLGVVNGLTVWALVLVGTLLLDVPSSLEVFGFTAAPLSEWGADPLWASFWSVLGGLAVALVGGTVGGSLPEPPWIGPPTTERRRAVEAAPDRDDPEGRTPVGGPEGVTAPQPTVPRQRRSPSSAS